MNEDKKMILGYIVRGLLVLAIVPSNIKKQLYKI
jgi:hypothetical protein